MKINRKLLENVPQYDPFEDMPPGTKKKCELRAELVMLAHQQQPSPKERRTNNLEVLLEKLSEPLSDEELLEALASISDEDFREE